MKFNRYVRSTGMPVTRVRIEHPITIAEIATILALLDIDPADLTKTKVESKVRYFLRFNGADEIWGFDPDHYPYDVDKLAETFVPVLLDLYGLPADVRPK
jgi:hypothetical protein